MTIDITSTGDDAGLQALVARLVADAVASGDEAVAGVVEAVVGCERTDSDGSLGNCRRVRVTLQNSDAAFRAAHFQDISGPRPLHQKLKQFIEAIV